MAQYLDEPLKSKIDSMKWVLDDESHVHVDVKSNQPLTKEDMDALKSEIEGQNSDGLGEGFEQQKFAEGYYDPDTGEGPYSYQEMMDIVTENYDNMDVDDYRDYIDQADIEAAVDNYIQTEAPSYQEYMEENWDSDIETAILEHADEDQYIAAVSALSDEDFDDYESAQRWVENNSDESEVAREIFDNMDTRDYESIYYDSGMDEAQRELAEEEVLDDIETYLDEDAIERAKQEAAKDDPRFNETLWGDGMISMEWDIPDGVNVTKPISSDKLNNDNFWENEVKVGDKLNSSGAGEIEILDLDKNSDYILLKRDTDYEKYVAAWGPDSRDGKLSWGQGHYFDTEEEAREYFNDKSGRKAREDYSNLDKEDRIAEEAWQEAANMKADTDDEKIDRALRMAASDKIGYETSLSSIINTARHNYSGDKTDEEIAPIARRIANEYGLHYEDDMVSNESQYKIGDEVIYNGKRARVAGIDHDAYGEDYQIEYLDNDFEGSRNIFIGGADKLKPANKSLGDDLLDLVDKHYSSQIDGDTVSTIASAFNDINDSHAFGINKAVDKLLENGNVVEVTAGNNGSNRVELKVNGKNKITFTDKGYDIDGNFTPKEIEAYTEAVQAYYDNKDSDVSFNFNRNSFEANVPKNADRLVPMDPYNAQEEAERITRIESSPKMSESRRVSVLNGFEEDAYPIRNYRTRQDAYSAYQNGEISFEEYEEIVRKLARR